MRKYSCKNTAKLSMNFIAVRLVYREITCPDKIMFVYRVDT